MVGESRARRVLRHLFFPRWRVRRAFPTATLARIETAIHEAEKTHRAELRFAVEGGLDVFPLWRRLTPRARAIALFSELRVWDTAENCGVLIYVQLADRCIEVVADRGIDACVPQAEWEDVCRHMEAAFRAGRFEAGTIEGVGTVSAVLSRHFPSIAGDRNELPDQPVIV